MDIKIDDKILMDKIKFTLSAVIDNQLETYREDIKNSIKKAFHRGILSNVGNTKWDDSLDYAIHACVERGVNKALENVGFSDMIAEKCVEILKNNDLITELAMAKIKRTLGV